MNMIVKFVTIVCLCTSIRAELKLISVVFRHGDRAPDSNYKETYPTDPYANKTYYPIGPGGLTNTGKMREYRLGQYLRQRYDNFLGPMYYKGVLSARSTFTERTMESLQLVLAGLYPPKGNQTWNNYIHWQPIPISYKTRLDDVLMLPIDCPKYVAAHAQVENSAEYRKRLDKFRPLMKNLTINTGKLISTIDDMFFLYHGLVAINSMKLPLPKWTNGIFPNGQLYQGALLRYIMASYNDELKRLNGGMLLRKITDDMTASCHGKLEGPRKLFLYSGHEVTIAAVLQALGAYNPHVPRFTSAVIVELHKTNNRCFVRIKYYKGLIRSSDKNKAMVVDLKARGCSKTSSLAEFKSFLRNHIATDDDIKSCDKRSLPEFVKTHRNIPKGTGKTIEKLIEQEKKLQSKLE